MSLTRKPRTVRPPSIALAGAMVVGVLVAVPAASVGEGDAEAAAPRAVELSGEPGSPVRTAQVPLAPGGTDRRTAAAGAGTERFDTDRFTMVAFTWSGAAEPHLRYRTLTDGRWGAWTLAEPLVDGPTVGTGEARRSRAEGASDLAWVGASSGIEVAVDGAAPEGLELVLVDPGELPADRPGAGRDQRVGASPDLRTARKAKRAPKPKLRPRKRWGADSSWRSGKPRYNKKLKQVHVHHTATHNDYKKRDVPAIIRGMYSYHTRTLGWSDIGYNFLVDRFGRAWVGRAGGPGKLVRGAHTLGFNHASTGVSVIGNYETAVPTDRVIRRLLRVAAWKLDRHGRWAAGNVRVTSKGSSKYPSGTKVRLPAIDGHRDTGHTACPGENVYNALPEIRTRAQKRIDRFS